MRQHSHSSRDSHTDRDTHSSRDNLDSLHIVDIAKRYTASAENALEQVSLSVAPGEVLALAGESGCGKTTLLRVIAGFERPTRGSIALGRTLLSDPHHSIAPEHRHISMVFQELALFPHLTIADNIAFGITHLPAAERRNRVRALLHSIRMSTMESRYPHELSGGQIQRVSIARALAPIPRIILLDEPFNNLDDALCRRLIVDVRAMLEQSNTTAILTTHRHTEAFAMADRIALMRRGRIVQVADPRTLYHTPRNSYVACFFGPINEITAHTTDNGFDTPLGTIAFDFAEPPPAVGTDITLLVRPHDIELFPHPNMPCRWRKLSRFLATVRTTQYYGYSVAVEVETPTGGNIIRVDIDPHINLERGQQVEIAIPHHSITLSHND